MKTVSLIRAYLTRRIGSLLQKVEYADVTRHKTN